MKYRIVKWQGSNGYEWYNPQRKGWFFWKDLCYTRVHDLKGAKEVINNHRKGCNREVVWMGD